MREFPRALSNRLLAPTTRRSGKTKLHVLSVSRGGEPSLALCNYRSAVLTYFIDSCAGTQPKDRRPPEASRRERDVENALQQKADDDEGSGEDDRGDGRSGEIDKRPLSAVTARRARPGQAKSLGGHEEGIPGENFYADIFLRVSSKYCIIYSP